VEQYEAWKTLLRAGEATGWQEFYVKFYQAFIDGSRWKQYVNGVGTTLVVTAMALAIGILLGILVAMVRTAHDQQRVGKRNPVLGVLNTLCQVYVTVIRGTPMMVQLLIMGFVVFSSSRNYTMVGALTLGINSGAYVSEIIRGGLMALDPGQAEAGQPGSELHRHHALHRHSPGLQGDLAGSGQRVHYSIEGHLPDYRHRRQGAGLRRPGHLRQNL